MYVTGGIRELELNILTCEYTVLKKYSQRGNGSFFLLFFPPFISLLSTFVFPSLSFSLGSNSERPHPRVELYTGRV